MRLYAYTIYSDSGFAPNPYWDYCTLATCKPTIRLAACVGDWVMATGSGKNVGRDRLVYAMRVEEKMGHDEYFRDQRFYGKVVSDPERSPSCRGDNMYFVDEQGRWRRAPLSFRHAELWRVRKDLAARFVLASKDAFWYFGREAVCLPGEFYPLVYTGGGDTAAVHEGALAETFVKWTQTSFPPGKHGEPFECITATLYGKTPEPLPDDLIFQEQVRINI